MDQYKQFGTEQMAERKALAARYQEIQKGILDVGDDFFRVCAIADCSVDINDAENYIVKLDEGKQVISTPRNNNGTRKANDFSNYTAEADAIYSLVNSSKFPSFDPEEESLLMELSSDVVPVGGDIVVPSPRGAGGFFEIDGAILPTVDKVGSHQIPATPRRAYNFSKIQTPETVEENTSEDQCAVRFRKAFNKLLQQYARNNNNSSGSSKKVRRQPLKRRHPAAGNSAGNKRFCRSAISA